jgi:glycosyltransferase involved in cell wall biosynthesis
MYAVWGGPVSPPLISVVIPVFNAEPHLAEALDSVVTQSHPSIEVLVIDDGSTDGSGEVARRYPDPRIRVVSQPNSGPAAARNRGVLIAKGEFLAFLDADDIWEPFKLKLQLDVLQAHPNVAMVFGDAVHVQANPDSRTPRLVRCGGVMRGHSVGTLLIRATEFHRVGPFSTQWRVGEFLDWYARAIDLGLEAITVPEVVLMRRLHGDNLGRRERAAKQDYARVIASTVARRRRITAPNGSCSSNGSPSAIHDPRRYP